MKERLIYIAVIVVLVGGCVWQYAAYNSNIAGFDRAKKEMQARHAVEIEQIGDEQAREREKIASEYESKLQNMEVAHADAQAARVREFNQRMAKARQSNDALEDEIRKIRHNADVTATDATASMDRETAVELVACCQRGKDDLVTCREDCEKRLLQQESELKQTALSDLQALEMALEKSVRKAQVENARADEAETSLRVKTSNEWWKYLLTGIGGAAVGVATFAVVQEVR